MKKGGKNQMHSTFTFCWRCGWTLWDGSSSLITSVDGTSMKLICMPLLKWVVSYLKKINYAIKSMWNVQKIQKMKNQIKHIEH